jgi:hypothetical protein
MVNYLHGRISSQRWFDVNKEPSPYTSISGTPTSNIDRTSCQGVLLRTSRGQYITQPKNLEPRLLATVQRLNVEVAFTMCTDLTELIFSGIGPNQTEFVLPHDGTQYQILESFEEMSKATSNKIKRFQYTCFVRRERALLLWHDDVEQILIHGEKLERELLTVVSFSLEVFVLLLSVHRFGARRFRIIYQRHSHRRERVRLITQLWDHMVFHQDWPRLLHHQFHQFRQQVSGCLWHRSLESGRVQTQ